MRSRQAETEQKSETTPTIEVIDFKTKFAETKAYAKVRKRFFCVKKLSKAYLDLVGA
jgi:hypothetical protein